MQVSFAPCPDYEAQNLQEALRQVLQPLGGMEAFVQPGQKVLLKPNLLSADPPEKRITTHPALAGAVARLVQEAGAQPWLGDSPALDAFKKTSQTSGLAQIAQDLGIPILELDQPRLAPAHEKAVFKSLELSARALEADVIINLPKFKTHSQMLLTLGVKNLFGTVVAQRKAEWHHMAGLNLETFANLLLDINLALKPRLTILDGIWGMEGHGPSNGKYRDFRLLAASADALALDLAVCRLFQVPLASFPLYRAALNRGFISKDLSGLTVLGAENLNPPPAPLDLPEPGRLNFLPPGLGWLESISRRYVVSRPMQNVERCVLCLKCLRICPEKCIIQRGRSLVFRYRQCIRCYCCQEVCPANAIKLHKGLMARILELLGR